MWCEEPQDYKKLITLQHNTSYPKESFLRVTSLISTFSFISQPIATVTHFMLYVLFSKNTKRLRM